MFRTIILTSILFLLWNLSFTAALVGDKEITLRILSDFEQFGFAKGGFLSLKVQAFPPQSNVSLYICTDKEFDLLSSYDPNEQSFCNNPGYCEYNGDYRVEVNYNVRTKNKYHLVLIQCGIREPVKMQVEYVLLNPGNQQLPLGEIPLPNLYILVTVIWIILVSLCGIIWMRNKEHIVMLHMLLCTVGVLKLAVVVVALAYWHTYESSGHDIAQLKYLQSFIYALSETAFFCSLLLISKGWRITRSTLPPSEIRTISVALVLLLSTLLFFSFYNDGYYFLSLMIMYFFMLPKIFTSITRNTRALHTHMLLARYANVELNTDPILAKIKMFKTLRTAVILYLGSILIISSMKIIMWWFLVWVTFCVSECVTICMVVAVCILTRPRENGVFSPRAYFENGSFPILNMQQFDHFDELFGDQIWDPDLIFGTGAGDSVNAAPQIDMSEALVIEYPTPQFSAGKEAGYFPRLAIATLEKEKEKEKDKDKEKEKDNDKDDKGKGSANNGSGRGSGVGFLRRRGTSASSSPSSSSSNSLVNSTSALLSGSGSNSPSLSCPSSSSPLLLSPRSIPSITYADLDPEIVIADGNTKNNEIELTARSQATQTSPPPTPIPFPSLFPTTTATTTTSTSITNTNTTDNVSLPNNNNEETIITINNNSNNNSNSNNSNSRESPNPFDSSSSLEETVEKRWR